MLTIQSVLYVCTRPPSLSVCLVGEQWKNVRSNRVLFSLPTSANGLFFSLSNYYATVRPKSDPLSNSNRRRQWQSEAFPVCDSTVDRWIIGSLRLVNHEGHIRWKKSYQKSRSKNQIQYLHLIIAEWTEINCWWPSSSLGWRVVVEGTALSLQTHGHARPCWWFDSSRSVSMYVAVSCKLVQSVLRPVPLSW